MSVVIRPMQGGKGPRVRTSEEALKEFTPTVKRAATRPTAMGIKLFTYIMKQKIRGRKKFPLVTMLEPLEACNLTCEGVWPHPRIRACPAPHGDDGAVHTSG